MNRPIMTSKQQQMLSETPSELFRYYLDLCMYASHLEGVLAQLTQFEIVEDDYIVDAKITSICLSSKSSGECLGSKSNSELEAREKQLLGEIEQLKEQLNEAKHVPRNF